MVKKIFMLCLLAIASLLLSIVGGCMVIIAFAGGGATTLGYLRQAAIIWIAGTTVAVLSVIAITYYLTRITHSHSGNQSSPNKGNDFNSKNTSVKGR